MKAYRLGTLGTAAWLLTTSPVAAQTVFNWDPPPHFNIFSTASNWTPAGPPGTTGEARFNTSASADVVAFNTDPTNVRTRVGNDHVTFDLNGHTYTLTTTSTSSPSIMVGGITLVDDALLTVRDGTLVGQHAVIAPAIFQTASGMVVDTGGTLDLAGTFTVGKQKPGSLTVQGGGDVLSATGVLGESGAGDGSVTVTGNGSTWHNSGSVYVGGQAAIDGGNGTLSISSQGLVDIDGTLKLWPGGSVALNGGTLETAVLDVAGGTFNWTAGTLRYSAELIVDPTGPLGGSVAVGAGKSLEVANGNLVVGDAASGALTISDGAGVIVDNVGDFGANGSLRLGEELNSYGAIYVDNASLLVGPFINVGVAGAGRLEIRNGGDVANQRAVNGFFGENTLAGTTIRSGQVIVAGDGSTLLSQGNFMLNPTGSLEIIDGASVRIMRVAVLEIVPGNGNLNGAVEISDASLGFDGRLTIGGSVNVAMQGRLSSGEESEVVPTGNVRIDGVGSLWNSPRGILVDGTLTVSNGGTTQTSNISVGVLGDMRGNGNIVGDVQNGGVVAPGASPGALHIDGDYAQTANGELLIELASASNFDQLLVTQTATLAGKLTVNLLDGFTPTVAQSFTILTADDVDGMFTTEMLPTVPGLIFDVIYNPQSVVLTVSAAFTADFDDDGDVDSADFNKWQRDFADNNLSDADDDGDSDGNDFLIWQRQFGSTASVSISAAVPEPSAFILALTVALIGAAVRRARV